LGLQDPSIEKDEYCSLKEKDDSSKEKETLIYVSLPLVQEVES
jgi:hypothetical protein